MKPALCSRCGKNVAVIFITKLENGQARNEGLCLKCARELHIKPVDDIINRMGIPDEELEGLAGDMTNALNGAEELLNMEQNGEDTGEDDGKTATFPFLSRLFGGPAAQNNGQVQRQHEALMTSMKSYKALVAELDNIVRVQIPENNKAIEIARGFGDFSENAEYDAAKERRRFLHRRRSELETLVATVQPLNFLEFSADTSKVSMGTQVTIQDPSGTEKVYSIVGAWDGDPDRNLVSYKTKFGEALLGAKPGDSVTLPDGSSVTVKTIGKLADDLARELSPEE